MTVNNAAYQPYRGPLTARWSRFFILPRYALRETFKSKVFINFFAACFLPILFFAAMIYMQNFPGIRKILSLNTEQVMLVSTQFFLYFLMTQSVAAYGIALVAGPGLITADLDNNALPLYLARPISRLDYILGKMLLLAFMLSLITWIPGLMLFFMHGYFTGGTWLLEHLRLGLAIFLGFAVLIIMLTLIVATLSIWLRSKAGVGVAFLAGPLILSAFSLMVTFGHISFVVDLFFAVWSQIFRVEYVGLSPRFAWLTFALITVTCVVIIRRKLHAFEVVT